MKTAVANRAATSFQKETPPEILEAARPAIDVAPLERLEAELERLAARVATLEHEIAAGRRRRRDRHVDDALLVAIARAVGGRVFSAHDLGAHARVDDALRHAIGSRSVKAIGLALREIARRPGGDLRLARVTRDEHGAVWQLMRRA